MLQVSQNAWFLISYNLLKLAYLYLREYTTLSYLKSLSAGTFNVKNLPYVSMKYVPKFCKLHKYTGCRFREKPAEVTAARGTPVTLLCSGRDGEVGVWRREDGAPITRKGVETNSYLMIPSVSRCRNSRMLTLLILKLAAMLKKSRIFLQFIYHCCEDIATTHITLSSLN